MNMTRVIRSYPRENIPNGWLSIDVEDGLLSDIEITIIYISS